MAATLQAKQEAAHAEWKQRWAEGPTHLRHESLPVQYGDKAPDVEVLNAASKPLKLHELWQFGA